jgi:hypothetical protein
MGLCETCRAIDFNQLIIDCFIQCRYRQASDESDCPPHPDDDVNVSPHHGEIFEVGRCALECGLCNIIFEAFKKRPPRVTEVARGLPLVFRPLDNKIEVCYDTVEELIKLCRLDLYTDGAIVEYIYDKNT